MVSTMVTTITCLNFNGFWPHKDDVSSKQSSRQEDRMILYHCPPMVNLLGITPIMILVYVNNDRIIFTD